MSTYTVTKTLSWSVPKDKNGCLTEKSAKVCRMFGLTLDRIDKRSVSHSCTLEINDGDIVYITGPSGAGKSVLLRQLESTIGKSHESDCVNLDRIELPRDKTVIDCIEGDFLSTMRTLSTAGLNDVFCILNKPANLSDGQKYRLRLAMALSAKKKFVFADEFCSNIDRITAAIIAFNVHKFANRTGTIFILASSHDDFLLDLLPDVLVTKELSGETQVIYKIDRHHRGTG
jgi:ABC-type ATPase with predicted acetyltransferase domain